MLEEVLEEVWAEVLAESGRNLVRRGVIWATVSAGVLFLYEHASSSARTIDLFEAVS